jgi:hypothetical protein
MLRSFEAAESAALLGDEVRDGSGAAGESAVASGPERAEVDQTRALVRDALLALAPIAIPTISPAVLDSADVAEECRQTRAAIALNDPALHNDTTIRGHLALCSACRSAEHAWQSLSIAVEEALRGALRDTRLPPALADQLQVAIQPDPTAAGWALLSSPRARIALVALPVLALIAFLVWPRGVPPGPGAGPRSTRSCAPRARSAVPAASWPGRLAWPLPDAVGLCR